MGPVACVAQLVEASGAGLGPAIASVNGLLGKASKDDVEWYHAVADAAAGHLERPGAPSGPHGDALLALLSRAADQLRAAGARGAADPDGLQYSLIRKLVGQGAHAAALRLGWELYEALTGAQQPGAAGAKGAQSAQQRQRQEHRQKQQEALMTGAVINLVVCSAEAGLAQPADCGRLGAAVQELVTALRSSGDPAAASKHADVLVRYLLKLVQRLGAGPASQLAKAAPGLRPLVCGMLQACALSSQPDKLPQVLLRACSCLPADLGHCGFEALLECAPGSSAPAAAAWLDAQQTAAALDLLVRFAQSKGLAARWAARLAGGAGLSPLAGLWVAALGLQADGSAAGAGPPASSQSVATAAAFLGQLASCSPAGSGSSGGGANGGGASKQGKAGRAGGGSAGGGADEPAVRLWVLQLASAGIGQLQLSVASAAEQGDWSDATIAW